jgi:hypothetical protein
MGKNPNAKRLKEKKHKAKDYGNDVEDLEEEAARLGMTVLELIEQKEKEQRDSDDSDEDENESGDEEEKKQTGKKGGKK